VSPRRRARHFTGGNRRVVRKSWGGLGVTDMVQGTSGIERGSLRSWGDGGGEYSAGRHKLYSSGNVRVAELAGVNNSHNYLTTPVSWS
jgi:hypothetical protein